MPDETPTPRESKLKSEVEELKKSVRALLVAVGKIEEETDIQAMPEGVYHGIKFE